MLRHVNVQVMHEIGPDIILREGLPRTDVIGVGSSVDLDQLRRDRTLRVRDLRLHLLEAVLLRPDALGHGPGLLERQRGVLERPDRPIVQLLVVALGVRPRHQVGIDVERHAVPRQAQRRETRLGIVQDLLRLAIGQRQLGQLEHRGAVDLLDAFV